MEDETIRKRLAQKGKKKKLGDRDRIGQGDRENGAFLLPVFWYCLLFLGVENPFNYDQVF